MINKNLLQDVVFCNDDASVLDVSRILRDTRTRHLIVVNEKNNRVVAEEKNSSTLKARDIMTKPIETVEVSSTCEEAYQKMVSKGTYSIPVTENGSLIGSLSFSKSFGKVC